VIQTINQPKTNQWERRQMCRAPVAQSALLSQSGKLLSFTSRVPPPLLGGFWFAVQAHRAGARTVPDGRGFRSRASSVVVPARRISSVGRLGQHSSRPRLVRIRLLLGALVRPQSCAWQRRCSLIVDDHGGRARLPFPAPPRRLLGLKPVVVGSPPCPQLEGEGGRSATSWPQPTPL